MRRFHAASLFGVSFLCLSSAPALRAQDARPSSCSAGGGNRLVRAVTGATLGGWLGFVGAKIKMSDWNDASRGAAANRTRNRATIGGALVGAALGSLSVWSHSSCARPLAIGQNRPPESEARRPITSEEIQRSGITGSVYDLVYSLRRTWLNVRGLNGLSETPRTIESGGQEIVIPAEPELMVYLDNTRLGTISQLHDIPIAGIIGVRYFDGPQATFKWGAGHTHGAIQVITSATAP